MISQMKVTVLQSPQDSHLLADILLEGLVEDVMEEVGDGAGHAHEGEGGEKEVPGGEEGAVALASRLARFKRRESLEIV